VSAWVARGRALLLAGVWLLGCAGAAGCSMEVKVPIGEHVVEGNPILARAWAGTGDDGRGKGLAPLELSFGKAFQPENVSGASVQLTSMWLVIAPGSQVQDFDWLDEVHVFVQGRPGSAQAELPALEVARALRVPEDSNLLQLETLPVEVSAYLAGGAWVVTHVKARPPPGRVIFGGQVTLLASE
jgi:hypothetical protein